MRSSIILVVVFLAMVIFLTVSLPLGIIVLRETNKLKKEIAISQQLADFMEQQLTEKERQITQLSEELEKLSENSKIAKTQ